jgi:hypothetical protein
MSETNQTPPPLPPQMQIPPPPLTSDDPLERAPIHGLGAAVEAILRQPRRVMHALRQPGAGRVVVAMVLVALVCALVYGVVVGTFSRGPQLWIAPLKIAGGMLVAAVICLPSLYIFACLSGSRARVAEMAGLVAGLLLLTTLLLVGFAPVAWLFSESTNSLCWMGALHLFFWVVATGFGLRFLGAGFAGTQAKSQAGLRVWAVIFVLVCLQLTTALRPLVGTADTVFPGATEKKFFLKHWLDCLDQGESRMPGSRGRED